jgi:hypothetical protein
MLAARPVKLPEAGSIPALAAIIFAIVFFTDATPMVIASGVACAGTAVLISTEGGPANRLLSLAPCVGIGLISYSLYLWHWPLLAFANYRFPLGAPVPLRLSLLLAAAFLAFLSYRFVEKPLRRPGEPRRAFLFSAATMAVLVAAGLAIALTKGFPSRYAPSVAAAEAQFVKPKVCDGCSVGSGPTVVVWGDSYGMASTNTVEEFARTHGLRAVIYTRPACPPLFGAEKVGDKGCAKFHAHDRKAISTLDPAAIVLISRWSISSETTRFLTEGGTAAYLADRKTKAHSVAESRRALVEGLFRTVSVLSREHPKALILLVGQAPELGLDPERCFISGCAEVPRSALPRIDFGNRLLDEVSTKFPGVRAVYLSRSLCNEDQCRTTIGGLPVYRDPVHLSDAGSRALLGPYLARELGALRSPQR